MIKPANILFLTLQKEKNLGYVMIVKCTGHTLDKTLKEKMLNII